MVANELLMRGNRGIPKTFREMIKNEQPGKKSYKNLQKAYYHAIHKSACWNKQRRDSKPRYSRISRDGGISVAIEWRCRRCGAARRNRTTLLQSTQTMPTRQLIIVSSASERNGGWYQAYPARRARSGGISILDDVWTRERATRFGVAWRRRKLTQAVLYQTWDRFIFTYLG